jgi:hypothetical protein
MRVKLRKILGILNILACTYMVFLIFWYAGGLWPEDVPRAVFTWGLMFIFFAILALVSCIYTLKGRNLLWSAIGPAVAVIGTIYYLLLVELHWQFP